MLEKVLIAEDHESASISVQKSLEELGISDPDCVYYCDDALVRIQKGQLGGQPYDLLITDLYFEKDHRDQKILGGEALIAAARQVQPYLKILVFSSENRPAVIETLFDKLNIDGYVRKARNDARELKLAIEFIDKNRRYFPRHLMQMVKQKNTHEFTEFDMTIVSLLSQGVRQKDIPAHLEKMQIRPSGLSSVEKRLNYIRGVLNFANNEQLVAYCKDMGIA